MTDVQTPIHPEAFDNLLEGYDPVEREFIKEGFTIGFRLEFQGERQTVYEAPNLKTAREEPQVLWEKIMKEVKLGRYAGPFPEPPYEYYRQSPLGLVPKDGGKDLRMIFHLSFPEGDSVNSHTPKDKTTVQYNDFDQAVRLCLQKNKGCFMAKSDLKSAFRNIPIHPDNWHLLVMKATNPRTGKEMNFVDKCLPFGAAISCAHFQRVSNALAWIVKNRTQEELDNYLDDFFFVDNTEHQTNSQLKEFIQVCDEVGMPVSPEKTFWATTLIVFLGLLINTVEQWVAVPEDKIEKATKLIKEMLKFKKATIAQLQSLAGVLNFLCKAVVPGRAFIRRIYDLYQGKEKKRKWHLRLNAGIREDLQLWLSFLGENPWNRPFMDFQDSMAEEIGFFTDASAAENLGFGAYFRGEWVAKQWPPGFIVIPGKDPSIAPLELYALTVGVVLWAPMLRNRRVIIRTDNQAAMMMVNKNTSKCPKCMVLIRIIVKESMRWNVRFTARHVKGVDNTVADALSRLKFDVFWQVAPGAQKFPREVALSLWPVSKLF